MSVSFLVLPALVALRTRLLSQAFDRLDVCHLWCSFAVVFLLCLLLPFFSFMVHFIYPACMTHTFWLVTYYATSATLITILYVQYVFANTSCTIFFTFGLSPLNMITSKINYNTFL